MDLSLHDEPVARRHALGDAAVGVGTKRTSRVGEQARRAAARSSTTTSVPTPVRSHHRGGFGRARPRDAIVYGSAMMPCCVRLTRSTSRPAARYRRRGIRGR